MAKAAPKSKRIPLELKTDTPLPRYCERDHRNGNIWFRAGAGPRVLLPNDPTTTEFCARYSVALCNAAAAEKDDDWRELEAMHAAQRRDRR
jgi:hypothetical protein